MPPSIENPADYEICGVSRIIIAQGLKFILKSMKSTEIT